MLLEIFSHERLVGKMQLVAYLLDVLGGIAQLYTNLQDDIAVYPLVGGALADLLDNLREVLRGDAELLGIPADTPFVPVVLLQQTDELRKDGIGTFLGLGPLLLYAPDDVAHVVEHSQQQGLHQVRPIVVIAVGHLFADGLVVVAIDLYLAGRQLYHRVVGREDQQRRDVLDVLYKVVVERRRYHDAQTLKVWRRHVVVDDMPFRDEQQVAGFHHLLARINAVLGASLLAQGHEDEVQPGRLAGYRGVGYAVGQHQLAVQAFCIAPQAGILQAGLVDMIVLTHGC